MENAPKLPLSEYAQAAVDIYDAADRLFAARNIPSQIEKPADRCCKIKLTADELARVGQMLVSYAIDAPDSAEIMIEGYNPYKSANNTSARLWIATKHTDYHTYIDSTYAIHIDSEQSQPAVTAYKIVKSAIKLYSDRAPLEPGDQRGLAEVMRVLSKPSDIH